MPHFDGTGPSGRGPMTGRGQGYCIVRIPDGDVDPVEGFIGIAGRELTSASSGVRGYGPSKCWPRGGGYSSAHYCIRNMPRQGRAHGEAAKREQLDILKAQAARIESVLVSTRERIRKLELESSKAALSMDGV